MFAFKKKYRPIRGQKWWERVLNILTFLDWYKFFIFNNIFLLVGIVPAIKLFDGDERALIVAVLYLVGDVFVVIGTTTTLVLDIWQWRRKDTIRTQAVEFIQEKKQCTYDDLVGHCMPVKIHHGFNEVLDRLQSCRVLVVEGDICRLPTSEDKRRWHDEDVTINGVSFEELEQVFAHPLEWYGGELRIEFSVWEDEEHCLEKVQDAKTGAEIYVCTVAGGERYEFVSFAELAAAPLFDGKNLREVCEKIAVSYANDFSWTPEFFELNCTQDDE